jgi:hypothetical protein
MDESLCYTCLETAPGKQRWIPLVNLAVRKCGRVVDYYLLENAAQQLKLMGGNPSAFKVAGAWFVDAKGVVQLSLRTNGHPDAGAIAHHLGDTIGLSGGGRERASCIQFKNEAHFFSAVPFFTRAQMLKLQAGGKAFIPREKLFSAERLSEPPRSSTPPLASLEPQIEAPPSSLVAILRNRKSAAQAACHYGS